MNFKLSALLAIFASLVIVKCVDRNAAGQQNVTTGYSGGNQTQPTASETGAGATQDNNVGEVDAESQSEEDGEEEYSDEN